MAGSVDLNRQIPFALVMIGFIGGIIDNEFQVYCLLTLFFGIILIMVQDSRNDKRMVHDSSTDTLVDQWGIFKFNKFINLHDFDDQLDQDCTESTERIQKDQVQLFQHCQKRMEYNLASSLAQGIRNKWYSPLMRNQTLA